MNHNRSHHHLDLTGPDQPDQLDDLLLKATMPEPSPWFAAETVARCRREKQMAARWSFLPKAAFSMMGLAATACLVIVGYSTLNPHEKVVVVQKPVQSRTATDAFLVIASIDSSQEEECDDSAPL